MLVLVEFHGNDIMWIYGPYKSNEDVLFARNKREEQIASLRGTQYFVAEPRHFSTMTLIPST